MGINIGAIIVGILGTIALSETMSFTAEKTAYSNSMVSVLLCVFSVLLLRCAYRRICVSDRCGRFISLVYSFGLSGALVIGKQLQTVENFAAANPYLWMIIFVLTVYFHGMVWFALQWLDEKMRKNEEDQKTDFSKTKKEEKKEFFFTWLVLFLCWLPVFFAFYPGAFVYDAQEEYVQVAAREFTTHHPLLHVLLLGGSVCFGNKFFASYNLGIALYTLLQMLVVSWVFAYVVSYLRTRVPKKAVTAIVLFYAFFPVIPMYAVCSAKDTLFNAAFLLLLLQLFKLCEAIFVMPKAAIPTETFQRTDRVLLILSAVGMMLLRKNGVYVVLAVGVFCAAVAGFRKKIRRSLLHLAAVLFISLALYTAADHGLAMVLQADDSENQELLTVPIQQLARTYKYSPEVFSKEEREILFSYIPEDSLRVYDADLSDLVKAGFHNERYRQEPSEFLGLWMRTFLKKPITYLNAWLMTSYGYWYPDTIINVYGGQQRFTFQYEESSYFGFETELPGTRDSKFPWLEEQYRKMSLELYQQKMPGISMLFSPGFLFWLFLASIALCFYQKRFYWLPVLGSIFLLWGTAILGPTFLVRYVLILWFALPLWSVLYYYDCKNEIGTRNIEK